MIKVAVTGGFDPIHSGHIDHIRKAKRLGDYLIVIVQSDENLIKKKGYVFMPYPERASIVRSLKSVDEVVGNIDEDGTSAETLRRIKPDVFAKGGDRTLDNMPKNEIEVCKQIGCEIVYGVGDQLNSSSDLVKTAWDKIVKLRAEHSVRIKCKKCGHEHPVRPGTMGQTYECEGEVKLTKKGDVIIYEC